MIVHTASPTLFLNACKQLVYLITLMFQKLECHSSVIILQTIHKSILHTISNSSFMFKSHLINHRMHTHINTVLISCTPLHLFINSTTRTGRNIHLLVLLLPIRLSFKIIWFKFILQQR
jgi:hypothetical protein